MKNLLAVLLILAAVSAQAQKGPLLKPARVIFYNTENLFDTINDPATNDEDFLPESKQHWNSEKYNLKLDHISKALRAMLDTIQPMVIGLAEVENKKVVEDLIAQPALKKFNFGIIHHDSPDERGIDVAMLYNRDVIEENFNAFLPISFPFDSTDKTRDILYMKGFVNEGEPLWIFVNHWSSRREGELGAKKRLAEEKILKDKILDVYKGEPDARVIVMGDLNDNPTDVSPLTLADATNIKNPTTQLLVNMMKPLYARKEFSLKYKDESDIFDQFFVSRNLLNTKASYFIRPDGAHIFNSVWLLFNHPKYGWIPNRTYSGDRWVKGYSDHLPVYMDIVFK